MAVALAGWTRRATPGLALACGIAAAATAVAAWSPGPVGPVLVAVVLGLLVGNTLRPGDSTRAGLEVASTRILRIGVVLLGARLTVGDVAAIGVPALLAVAACMALAAAAIVALSRLAGIPPRLACLLGVGTAVCGNSAILATAPAIDAEEREISVAIATVTLLGTSALLVFPVLAQALGLSETAFGLWSGLAINDTSQVVAAGAAYGEDSLDVATVVKLVRNTSIAPVVVLAAAWAARWRVRTADAGTVRGGAVRAFPLFVVGFLVLAAARSAGVIDADLADTLGDSAAVAITIAIAAVGVQTRVGELRQVGARPFLVGLGAALLLAGVALAFAIRLGE